MTRGKRKMVWSVTVRNRISFSIRLKADRRMNRGRMGEERSNRMNIQPTQNNKKQQENKLQIPLESVRRREERVEVHNAAAECWLRD